MRSLAAELLSEGEFARSEDFLARLAGARVQAAHRLARLALQTLDDGEFGEPTAQLVGLLLRLCILPRVLRLFRGHFARSLSQVASDFDTIMREVVAQLCRTPPAWYQRVHLQVGLPLRLGGMGLHPVAEIAPAAFLGS